MDSDPSLARAKTGLEEANLELRRKELEIRQREVELPVELASLGLRGTLTGAIIGLVVLVALALISAFSDKAQITGTHLCILAGIICTTVVMFGAFVFQRSVSIAALWKGRRVEVGTVEAPGRDEVENVKG